MTGSSREPAHSLGPGWTIQAVMFCALWIHIANGGIDWTASSCSSLTRLDMS